ncbi:MAG: phosphonate ABC transporter ATP-binding protein [Burkholderiaceae bacterium]|nr:phosphonate ABC transporter ATP-binding protein [Burkholderiaceae bacterium]
MARPAPLLRIESLEKTYPTGQRALAGVTFKIDHPQVVAIIGSSGAGKSTLIRCINRLVEPSAGRVLLGGEDLVALDRKGLRAARRRIGMIFQEFNLVERLTVMQNVLAGRLGYVGLMASLRYRFPPQDIRAAFELLDRVGLDGYHDQRADALSGGQRQRVGIARALMQRPELLLVDEPTASLDPKTSRQIMRLIGELATERATPALVNIHDVALAKSFADRIVGLKDGAIVFDDTPDALDDEALTLIYGAEDWNLLDAADEGEGDEPSEPPGAGAAARAAGRGAAARGESARG